MLANSGRIIETDKKFGVDVRDQSFANYLFVRLVAKGRTFTNVDFRYSMFDASYLRKCKFDSCNFTGCRFVSTNLFESTFIGCTFDYVVFERTFVDPEILETGCPGLENMKMRFARTLRMNYQQIGDAKAANAAMNVELQATAAHLTKAWRSNESYYRKKYTGWRRAKVFGQWIDFKVLDFVWGNGESLGKLLRAVLAVLVSISLIEELAPGI
jgi:hypothetical protein